MADPEQQAARYAGGIGDPGALARQELAVRAAQSRDPLGVVRRTTGEAAPLPAPNGEATSIHAAPIGGGT